MSHSVIQPEGWKAAKGYANGVLAQGKTLFSGNVTTGHQRVS